MKPYNNFTPSHRMKALRWLKKEYAAGRRHPPVVCDACGQTEGPIEAHSEDYSAPFGDHIGQYGVCYRCHMALHNRHHKPEAWATYKQHIREGRIFVPIGRNWPRFVSETLTKMGEGVPFVQAEPHERTFLDDLQ